MKVLNSVLGLLLVTQLFASGKPLAQGEHIDCLSYGRDLPVNNRQVLHWKRTTSNQFQERGHVKGPITEVYSDKNGHAHFQIRLGNQADDTLEVIYNEDFGALPDLKEESEVEACGDYITSVAKSGPYPPSPDGGIIHWVHMNPKNVGHPSGFLIIDNVLYGMDSENAGPKPYNKPRNPRNPR